MKKALCLLTALLMCLSLAACGGNKEKKFTVGICQLVRHDALDAATKGFKDALTKEFGDKVTFDEQLAQGDPALCSTIVNGFVSSKVDLIMANATPALQAAASATSEIPILGTSVTDFADALKMDFDAAKGSGINVSGSSDGVPAEQYVNLLLELVPDAKNVSILYCSAEANSVLQADSFIAAMKNARPEVTCTVHTFSDSNDIQMVTTAAVQNCDALYIPTDNQAATNKTIIRNVCEPAGIVTIAGEENLCKDACLATVSISYYDIGFACGQQAVKILKDGADIKTMPIAYAKDPVREFDEGYAKAIGFTVPEGAALIGK